MEGYMPSEVARMVLGYLKETRCPKTRDAFLLESHHLKEYAECLRQGKEYPTTIAGKSLNHILQDYCILTHIDWDCKTDKGQLIALLDKALSQVKHLMSTSQQNSKEPRPSIMALGARKQQSLVRRQAKRKLLLAKRNASRIAEDLGYEDLRTGNNSRVSNQRNIENRPMDVVDQIHSPEENVPVDSDRRFAACLNNKYLNTAEDRRMSADVVTNFPRSDPRIHSQVSSNVNSCRTDNGMRYNEAELRDPARKTSHVPEADPPTDNSPEHLRSAERFSNRQDTLESLKANAANSMRSANKSVRNLETIFRSPSSTKVHRSVRSDNFAIPASPSLQRRMSQTTEATIATDYSRSCSRYQNDNQPPVRRTYSEENLAHQHSTLPQLRAHAMSAENVARCEPVRTNIHQPPIAKSQQPPTTHASQPGTLQQISRTVGSPSDTIRPSNRTCHTDMRTSNNADSAKASMVQYNRIHPTALVDMPNYSNSKSVNNEVFHPPEITIQVVPRSSALQEQRMPPSVNCAISKQNEVSQNKDPTNAVRNSNFSSDFSDQERHPTSGQYQMVAANVSIGSTTNKTSSKVSIAVSKCTEKGNAQDENYYGKTLDLSSPENMTPLNSVEPALPSRYPEDCESPRYILSQQRSTAPSLTTPVKDHNDQNFYSPRRKSHIPRRRLIPSSSPLASQQQQEAEPILEELINFPPLLEKIAENINKVVSSDHQETSELDDTISATSLHIPDAAIKDILFRTETDPLFEEVLSLLCEKYDSSRDGGDVNQNMVIEVIDDGLQKDFQTQQTEDVGLTTPVHNSDHAPQDSSPDQLSEENENCNATVVLIEASASGSEATPQLMVPQNSEIILTNENLLALKNGDEIYVATSGGTTGGRPMEMINAVISNESDFGTCIQVLDKPIMSTMNPQGNGTYLMNAAAITPVKIAIPDFQFLTLSPSQLFGMNAYVVESKKSPEKKGPLILPKPGSGIYGNNFLHPREPCNLSTKSRTIEIPAQGLPIRRNRSQTLVRHRPSTNFNNQKKTLSIENNAKENVDISKKQCAIVTHNDSIFSSKSRMSRAHIRTLDFGLHYEEPKEISPSVVNQVPKEKQPAAVVNVQLPKVPQITTTAKVQTKKLTPPATSNNSAEVTKPRKVLPKPDVTIVVPDKRRSSSVKDKREDTDQVVAATLVSMANSTRNTHGSRYTKSDHNKKRKSTNDEPVQGKTKKKNQEKLLKGMDVDEFLSKIHAGK